MLQYFKTDLCLKTGCKTSLIKVLVSASQSLGSERVSLIETQDFSDVQWELRERKTERERERDWKKNIN